METREGEHPSMDSVRPPLHHHHHYQILPCHHHDHNHRHHYHHHHHHIVRCCAVHGFVLPPNGPPCLPSMLPPIPQTSTHFQPSFVDQQIQSSQIFEQEVACEELEEEEEEDPVFVLTDEWRDFFAKSEAKRREAKKQARKQGKK